MMYLRKRSLKPILAAIFITVLVASYLAASLQGDFKPLKIHTYSSPDPDAVNTYWIEGDTSVIAIGGQRQLSEARKALKQIQRAGKPIVGIIITVPHTDHFGGAGVFTKAFPNASIYASATTVKSMTDDEGDFIAGRRKILGDDFPALGEVVLPDRIVKNGDTIKLDAVEFRVIDLPHNNASTNTLLYLPTHHVMFSSELVENSATPFMAEQGTENWIKQIEKVSKSYSDVHTLYPAHGFTGPAHFLMRLQQQYLVTFKDLVKEQIAKQGKITAEGKKSIVQAMEKLFPEYKSVAKLPRANLIGKNVEWMSQELRNHSG